MREAQASLALVILARCLCVYVMCVHMHVFVCGTVSSYLAIGTEKGHLCVFGGGTGGRAGLCFAARATSER